MNSSIENVKNCISEDEDKEKDTFRNQENDKGDIDDYIFSWQTVNMFSER